MNKTIFTTIYLIDSSVSKSTIDVIGNNVLRGWYAGETEPSFIKKISELRNHPLTSDAHRAALYQQLPEYGLIDEKVYLEDEDDEDFHGQESFLSKSLSLMFEAGEISLYFAGPCILLEIKAHIFDNLNNISTELFEKIALIIAALNSRGDYYALDSEDIMTIKNANDIRSFVKIRLDRANKAENLIAMAQKKSKLLFGAINIAIFISLITFLIYGVNKLEEISSVDLNKTYTFVVQAKENASHRVIVPDFRVLGEIRETGEKASLNLYRDEYVSVFNGYELSVMKRNNPENPYILTWYVEKHSPLKIGSVSINIEIFIWLAFTVVWIIMLYKYSSKREGYEREQIRKTINSLTFLFGGGIFFALILVCLKGR